MKMNANQFCAALEKLGLTQEGGADFLDYDVRTMRRFMKGKQDVPQPVAKLLRLMIDHGIAPERVP